MSAAALAGEQFLLIDTYTVAEIALFARKNPSTVKRWFWDLKGVLKYPRGKGEQNESLGIPEPLMRSVLSKIGFQDAHIETGLVQPHRQRLDTPRAPAISVPEPPRKTKPIKKAARPARRR